MIAKIMMTALVVFVACIVVSPKPGTDEWDSKWCDVLAILCVGSLAVFFVTALCAIWS
ncbi:MAG: hypothetical protein GY862_27010 [Gammaproteobacteria bacterium]|nr:hypothetical protein [Gammaproteobacteria bacterium]MCP5013845.1 hypothetical protein [Ketobacter sp.]